MRQPVEGSIRTGRWARLSAGREVTLLSSHAGRSGAPDGRQNTQQATQHCGHRYAEPTRQARSKHDTEPLCRSSAVSVGGLGRVDTGCTLSASRFLGYVTARKHEEQIRVQNNRVWERACGLDRTVVEGVRYDETAGAIIVSVRPDSRARSRCGRCGRRSPGYDSGDGWRRWRALDAGTTAVFVEADAPRVQCRTHGQTVVQVPWARHGVGHTRDFDAMAAWLTVRTSKSATCQLLGVAWRTIGSIITRVNNDVEARVDRLEGLRRIGIDEISYKRGHRYLIVVVDHDTGRLVWAGPGRSEAALRCSSTNSESNEQP